MNLVINEHNIVEIVLGTFLVSFLLVPLCKKIAFHVGAIDMPNSRKVHTKPTPLLGGLAIFFTFLLGYIFYGKINNQMISILISSFIIFLTGFIDDIKPLRAKHKFLVELIAAAIVVFYGKIYFNDLSFFGIYLQFNDIVSYLLTMFFIVAITNAINLIDGLDGLCAGISSIYFLTIGVIAITLNKIDGLDIILTFIMLGSTLGFLTHNFPPAKIFMGDCGSLFLGFMISIIALLGFKGTTLTTLVIPITVLAIPIFDTLLAIFRRLLKGENIGTPDKEHFHHQLLKLKFSTRKSILTIYFINIIFASVSIFYVLGDTKIAIGIYIALLLLLVLIVLKTDILFQHKKKNKKLIR